MGIVKGPYKLDKKVARILVSAAKNNVSLKGMCALAGITDTTYYRWRDSDDPACVELFAAIDKARSEWERGMLRRIAEASKDPKHWTAAAWALERTIPERYAKRSVVDAKIETSEAGALKDATDGQLAAALRELGVEDDVPNPEADADDEG